METLEVGKALVALCKEGKFMDVIAQYYSDDIVSIEGASMPGMGQTMQGIDAIQGKNEWWSNNHEVHGMEVEGPFYAEGSDSFAVIFRIDVTNKMNNERTQSDEVALYKVADGKIVEERFLYSMA